MRTNFTSVRNLNKWFRSINWSPTDNDRSLLRPTALGHFWTCTLSYGSIRWVRWIDFVGHCSMNEWNIQTQRVLFCEHNRHFFRGYLTSEIPSQKQQPEWKCVSPFTSKHQAACSDALQIEKNQGVLHTSWPGCTNNEIGLVLAQFSECPGLSGKGYCTFRISYTLPNRRRWS